MRLSGYECRAPAAPVSQFPSFAAEQDHVEHLLEADLEGRGHGTQAVDLLWNVSILDGHPFRDLHAGQAGRFLNGQTGLVAGGLDATAEHAAPDLAAEFRDV